MDAYIIKNQEYMKSFNIYAEDFEGKMHYLYTTMVNNYEDLLNIVDRDFFQQAVNFRCREFYFNLTNRDNIDKDDMIYDYIINDNNS